MKTIQLLSDALVDLTLGRLARDLVMGKVGHRSSERAGALSGREGKAYRKATDIECHHPCPIRYRRDTLCQLDIAALGEGVAQ